MKTRSWFNRAFSFFPGCQILNRVCHRSDGFYLCPAGLVLEKRPRRSSHRSKSKFFDILILRFPMSLPVEQGKSPEIYLNFLPVRLIFLFNQGDTSDTYQGEAIDVGVIALLITDLFSVNSTISKFFQGSGPFSPTKKSG